MTTVPFDYSSAEQNGAYLLTAQFCDNDVVIAGGKGTNSMQAIDYKERKVIKINVVLTEFLVFICHKL